MRRILLFIGLMSCLTIPSSLSAQIVDSTVCGILANPSFFDGKIVRIKGVVIAGFEEFAIKGSGCNQMVNGIWLAYPEGTKGKAALRLRASSFLPWTRPQSSKMRRPAASTKCMEPVTDWAAPQNVTRGPSVVCVEYLFITVL